MRRFALPTLLAALVASGSATALAAPATGTASTAAASGAQQRVTLVLQPQSRTTLRALAAGHGRANPAALHAALPSAQSRRTVEATLAKLGFTVTRTTALTVEATAPASRVKASFGSARSVHAKSRTAQPLPSLPGSLRKLVTVAFGGDEGRRAFHSMVSGFDPAGQELRTAYEVSPADPAASPSGTVATVQLSDWNSADLSKYASDLGGPAPQLTQINDSGYPAVLNPDDSLEVGLDQEAIYAVAPNARQRLYKSDNSISGMYSSLIHIADDALDGVDDNVTAASISWGFCESDIGTDAAAIQLYTAFEDAFAYLGATGVTTFVASGDDGTSCQADASTIIPTDVSYPASSPQVVAVGGVSGTGSTANPTVTSWDDSHGATGGGDSKIFSQPTWQAADATGRTGRALPDVAALAGDPGFSVYSSTAGPNPAYGTVRGTSLASPVTAASLASSLATSAAHPYGIGEINSDLYSSAIHYVGFNDVVTDGGGGHAAPTAAHWDAATGLGTPKWDTIVGLLPGTPHLTPVKSNAAAQYFNTTTVSYRVTKSMQAIKDTTAATYRVDDVTFNNANCSLGLGTPATDGSATFTGSYDVTLGDAGYVDDPTEGPGYYDGDYTLAVIERDGSACRIGMRNATVDTLPPTITSVPLIRPASGTTPSATVAWGANDSLSGMDHYKVTVNRYNPNGTFKDAAVYRATRGVITVPVSLGYGYLATVQAFDRAGNSVKRNSVKTTFYDNGNFTFSSGWAKATYSQDFAGASRYAAKAGQFGIRKSVSAKAYYVIVRTGPSYGKAAVTVGSTTRTLDLYSSSVKLRVVLFAYSGTSASRNVVFKALGTRNAKSRGTTVVLDGLMTTS